MNYSKTKFSLNVQSNASQRSIPARLNDTARSLLITFNDGGVPYYLPDGCRAVFFAKKPDDNELINDCIIVNNCAVRYDFTANTTCVPGTLRCEMRIYGSDGLLMTSPKFIIVVDNRVTIDDSNHLSESESTAWDNIFLAEQQRVAAEETRMTAFEASIIHVTAAAENANNVADNINAKLVAGEFNGKNGTNGKNGLTPFIGENGNWWIGENDTGNPSQGADGKDGNNGKDGKDGKDGSDYVLTDADISQIASIVLEQMPIAEDIRV